MKPVQGATSGLAMTEPLLFERSRAGRRGDSLPPCAADVDDELPSGYTRTELGGLPELSEPDVVRHFTRLSQWNYGVDTGFYPLGSCTMKYNPKVNEGVVRLPGFGHVHPYAPDRYTQGALEILAELERYLCEIAGFAAVTLQPAAGAHGEFTGMALVRAYHEAQGRARRRVLIPDTAHGTNPASCVLNGYEVVQLPSGPRGVVEVDSVRPYADGDTAAIMLTNPNTLGLFERNIQEIAAVLHGCGALVYCDGANMNSLLGHARPGDMGVDVLQFNLHKTFSTPHGGGGPGSGPVGVSARLVPFLPVPRVVRGPEGLRLDFDAPQSIGKVKAFWGHFGVLVRAYAYLRELGAEGLCAVTDMAVLNANYLRVRLAERYEVAYAEPCLHECVLTDRSLHKSGIKTLDVAKGLIDRGFHPPTIYFPLCVPGAMMIEPTECESLETLDAFVGAMFDVLDTAVADPGALTEAPRRPVVTRLDEVSAARKPVLRWTAAPAQA